MKKALAIHSYKGGTGKTYFVSNLSIILALQGKNVCLIDFDIGAPSLNYVFEDYIDGSKRSKYHLKEFLDGKCSIMEFLTPIRHDIEKDIQLKGNLYLGLMNTGRDVFEFFETAGRKWQMNALKLLLKAKKELFEGHDFDYIFFDTSPGIKYWSINAIVCSDLVILLSTLNKSDLSGTDKMVSEIYESLEKENYIVLNMVPAAFLEKHKEIEDKIAKIKKKIIGTIPCSCDVQSTLSEYMLILKDEKHPYCVQLKQIAAKIEDLTK